MTDEDRQEEMALAEEGLQGQQFSAANCAPSPKNS